MADRPHVISGFVRDASGSPVSGARIFLASAPVATPDIAILSDRQGRFSITAPVQGVYQIQCAADGFAPANAAVKVAGADVTAEIRLKKL